MKVSLIALTLVAAAPAGCQSTVGSAKGTPNGMLTNAGFVAKRANTPEQIAVLNSLPPNTFVRQTANGKATNVSLRRPGSVRLRSCRKPGCIPERQGHAEYRLRMNRSEFGGGLDPDNIGDLSNWEPF
jgi:hypothetical protein